MPRDQISKVLESGIAFLAQGRLAKALESFDSAIQKDGACAEAHQYRGMALSQMGKLEEATAAFTKCVELAPEDAKAHYNFAVHLTDIGHKDDALVHAQRAVELSPAYEDAQILVERLGGPAAEVRSRPKRTGKVFEPVAREFMGHSIGFIRRMEQAWYWFGWVLFLLAVVVLFGRMFHNPLVAPADPNAVGARLTLKNDALSVAVVFGFIVSALTTFLYVLLDVIDRGTRFLWVIPVVVCSCCGAQAIPFGIYMLTKPRRNV